MSIGIWNRQAWPWHSSMRVSSMDRATQANASMVEETAAVAENLRRQSDELERLSSRFRVAASVHALQRRSPARLH